MYRVKKRDGSVVDFDISKISGAIRKAFDACERNYNENIIDMLALKVTSEYEPEIKDELVDVEIIQDCAEKILSEAGYSDVAKSYILYRKSRENVRNIDMTSLDYKMLVDNYLAAPDIHIRGMSSENYSIGGLILSNSGAITANYWLSEVYDEEISNAHRSGDIHIHDLSMLTGYCAGWSLRQLIREGIGGVAGRASLAPAERLITLCIQMADFLGIVQNEWAGAQTFVSFDTYLAPYVKNEHLSMEEVRFCMGVFVQGVNMPSRWGTQVPFVNITLDWTVPEDLALLPALVGGKEMDFCYKDCQKEMNMINKALLEVMMKGDSEGRVFTYPILTYALKKDFDWSDSENNRLLFESSAKYGIPYFANYIGSGLDPGDEREISSHLRLNPRDLKRKAGGYFGSGENTGSIGNVTINLPRIAYLAKDEQDFYRRLDRIMDLCERSLKTKRTVVTRLLNSGLYPYTKKIVGSFKNHFSTIGVIGMNEAGLNACWLKKDLSDEKTRVFAENVLRHMRERLSDYQEKDNDLYDLEATPAESTSYRLAKRDKERYPDIITASAEGTPYYTNSTDLPVSFTEDIFSALDIQNGLQALYTSGTAFHAYLGERLSGWSACALLVRKIAEHYAVPYFTISPTYSFCLKHGYLSGEVHQCPLCGAETEVYSRISGYYRPLKNWNEGKMQEFRDRLTYLVEGRWSRSVQDYRAPKKESAKEKSSTVDENAEYILFAARGDANCEQIREVLKNRGIEYTLVEGEDNPELAGKYEIRQIPTLIAVSKDQVTAFENASEILKYIMS